MYKLIVTYYYIYYSKRTWETDFWDRWPLLSQFQWLFQLSVESLEEDSLWEGKIDDLLTVNLFLNDVD